MRPSGENVSVCLLTYNHADLIESTLASIMDQSLSGYEIIISDDCSDDETWGRVLKLAEQDSRIKPLQTPHNLGMAGNANFAVKHCTRPYIALLHHDDIYRQDLLEKWVGVLERHPDVAFVFNPYGLYGSDFVYEDQMPGERIDGRWFLNSLLLARWGCVVRGTAMIRRSAWQQVDGMRERFGLLADVDLWMRLARSWPVGYVPEPVVAVRQQRPDAYPDIYKERTFSWLRRKFLYEIHAANHRESKDLSSWRGKAGWHLFRLRLGLDTVRWLSYAIVRNKPEIILTSRDGATMWDIAPIRFVREILIALYTQKAPHT